MKILTSRDEIHVNRPAGRTALPVIFNRRNAMANKKPGRKKMPVHRLRSYTSLIRFNGEEYRDVMEASELSEQYPATWIREVVVPAARKKLKQEQKDG